MQETIKIGIHLMTAACEQCVMARVTMYTDVTFSCKGHPLNSFLEPSKNSAYFAPQFIFSEQWST